MVDVLYFFYRCIVYFLLTINTRKLSWWPPLTCEFSRVFIANIHCFFDFILLFSHSLHHSYASHLPGLKQSFDLRCSRSHRPKQPYLWQPSIDHLRCWLGLCLLLLVCLMNRCTNCKYRMFQKSFLGQSSTTLPMPLLCLTDTAIWPCLMQSSCNKVLSSISVDSCQKA